MLFLKQQEINERYITNTDLENVLESLNKDIFKVAVAGKSVLEKNIYRVDFGTGNFKILLWSQMHGNETTTTKAVFNFLKSIHANSSLLTHFSFTFLPILNPDGAEAFTRLNANKVDLNRDSVDLSQPESQLLRSVFNTIKPYLALNMHDQRSIFSAGSESNPATLSFLAPAFNEACDINDVRTFAMQLIANMNDVLKNHAPDNIGRFDDSFNINCIGDQFTHLNVPTILFEAGFASNDYQRKKAQKLVEISLQTLFKAIVSKEYEQFNVNDYLSIPENEKNFVDLIIENFSTTNSELIQNKTLPVVFKEEINAGSLVLKPTIDFHSAPNYKYAHYTLNVNNQLINNESDIEKALQNVMIS
ncbi:M14 family zinc carboxypeptidase [Paenimyroides viscosum]|nr:M14 family zinc carboxypeptidase [Paenimyroides viscosum]